MYFLILFLIYLIDVVKRLIQNRNLLANQINHFNFHTRVIVITANKFLLHIYEPVFTLSWNST